MSEVCYLIDPEEMLKACQHGDLAKVRELLTRDSTLVNAKGAHHKTPLHWAAEKNNGELAQLLIGAGADLNAEVSWGMTPLQWAANMGSREVAEILLEHGARPQLNMWAAAGLGMLDEVQSFWVGPNSLRPNAGQTRASDLTAEIGKSSQAEDPGLRDGNSGNAAAPASYAELVSDAFYIAARNCHVEVFQFLLEKGADINHRGFFGAPGLHWAAIEGHTAMVEFLLKHGADAALRDQQFNSTGRGWAKEGKHEEIAEMLKERGVQK